MKGRAEYSAGGVVTRAGKVLLVRVRKERRFLWTFPKGHLERGETPRQAALREVREETGWDCRVRAPLALVRYRFLRRGAPVKKRVRWYWMEPERRCGRPDPEEIFGLRWVPLLAAPGRLLYPGDLRLLQLLRSRLRGAA